MFTITKQFSFSASHQLRGLPDDHPCSRCHGHNYCVELILESERLNAIGFVRDYRDLADVKQLIDETLDHRHLNDVMYLNPTAENLAYALYTTCKVRYPELVEVRVSETDKTWASFRPARPRKRRVTLLVVDHDAYA